MVGIGEAEFYALTPRAFNNLLIGRNKKEEALRRESWEMHRELVVSIIRPHLKKTEAKKSLKQLYPLSWDNQTGKPKKQTKNPVDFWKDIDRRTKKST